MRSVMSIPTGRRKKRLGDLLVDANVISEDQLMEALVNQKGSGKKLGAILIDMGVLTEEEIADALHHQLNIDFVHLSEMQIEESVLNLVSEPVLRKHSLVPFDYSSDNPNVLRVAMADPMDIIAVDDISIITNLQIETCVTTPTEIAKALDRYFGNAEAMKVADQYARERAEQYGNMGQEEEENPDIANAPIVQLVNKIIEQAVRQRTSDIHIEALETCVRVRYRVDGVLKEVMKYDINLLSAIVARIKIIGGMDISEKRKPQDGRITSMVDRQEFDIRVSILPTCYGEKIVMRLTSKQALTMDKKNLGFSDDEMTKFEGILKNPHGIILVTGPTGSGKSTTLYTALSELNTEEVNIITVEDPVEANINGINQVHVNAKAGLTFAAALRSILRQDPDIIMIGEIRDGETAQIAVQAAITGHLVVSTLHTNSAASTITRLADMGIESYMIADAVVGIIAQRLVRRLCPKCKLEKIPDLRERDEMGIDDDDVTSVLGMPNPEGCMNCNGTGYKGRIGVYEIMVVSQDLKTIISKEGDAEAIKDQAVKEGMNTLSMSAMNLVKRGITSMAEAQRISLES